MPESQTATWKLALGYTAFALVAFLLFFSWTFPSEAASARVTAEAAARGYDVRIGKLAPGLFGLTAKDVELRTRAPESAPEGKEPEPLVVDSLALRPSLFPLGVAFRASAFNGRITGAVGGIDNVKVKLNLDGVDLTAGNLKAFSGLDVGGVLTGDVDLTIPKTGGSSATGTGPTARPGMAPEPDLGQATGTITLTGRELALNGGAIESIPALSGGFPKIGLGNLDAKLTFDKGQGKVDELSIKGQDVTLNGSGTIRLAKRWDFSDANLELKFKLEEEARRRLGMVAAGLSMLQSDRTDPTFKVVHMTGYLGRPNFR